VAKLPGAFKTFKSLCEDRSQIFQEEKAHGHVWSWIMFFDPRSALAREFVPCGAEAS
jgi:hypothetical protein